MAVTYNIKGTTNSSFKVGKQGTGTLYAGSLEANNLQATGNLTVTGNLVVSGTTTTVNSTQIDVQNSLRFEGATTDDYETVLTVVDPTADRTVTIPNATGTLVLQDTTDTLSNKTLASPAFSGSVSGNVAFDTDTLFVDATNNRVGIGTTSPAYALNIDGGSQAKLAFSGGGTQSIYFGDSGTPFAGYIHYSHSTDQLRLNSLGTININGAYNIPTADGSSGQVLATDGADTVSFSSVGFPKDFGALTGSASAFPVGTAPDFGALTGEDLIGQDFGDVNSAKGISELSADTTPQLGGNLDAQSNNITAVGKLEITNTSTDDSLLITTTEDTTTAAPVLTFKRNSSSPANGDYLGQLKFKGENDADQEVLYAKITGKISDVTDTTEDGLLEFALRKAGSNNIGMRLTSTDLKLINGTGLEVTGDIIVGDNNSLKIGDGNDLEILHDGSSSVIKDVQGNQIYMQSTNFNLANSSGLKHIFANNDYGVTLYYQDAGKLETTSTGITVTGEGKFGVLASDPGGSAGYAKIYAKDESASAEMFVQDEAGNVTKISPHNEQGEWEYYSRNVKTGKVVRINMEEMIRDIESLTGKSYIKHE